MKKINKIIIVLLCMSAAAGIAWYTSRPVAPQQATWEDVEAEARAGGYRLMNADELWERYRKDRQGLLLVDTRQEWEYRTGHIQGAGNFPMEPTWWARFTKKEELKAYLGGDRDRTLVFY